MKTKWVKIFKSHSLHEIVAVQGMLKAHDIESRVLNKQDSMYVQFNNFIFIELYVPDDKSVEAIRLIEKSNEQP